MSLYEEKTNSTKLFLAPINTAGEQETSNVIECLTEGANINQQFGNDSNNTPLHICVVKEDLEVVDLLPKRGAKTDCHNDNGKTALNVAKKPESNVAPAKIERLSKHESKVQKNTKELKKSTVKNKRGTEYKYMKRDGTTGIKGKLYETKLITLIRIRSFMKEYDEFFLGTNLDGIGALDDVGVRYKNNNDNIIIYVQAKHKLNIIKDKVKTSDLWKVNSDFSLHKYFKSYLVIRHTFNETNSDIMFKGKYKDFKCYYVIYTSAGNELEHRESSEDHVTDENVKDLIQSGEYNDIFQYKYSDDEVELLTKSVLLEEMKFLGQTLINFALKNKFDMMLNDCYIRKYHVVLARNVINVTDVNDFGHRTGTFRDEFFNNTNELLITLREVLFNEAVKGTNCNMNNLKELVQAFVCEPTTVSVRKLIQSVSISYDQETNTLTVTDKTIKDISKTLSQVKIMYNVYIEAHNLAVKEKLNSICFILPPTFGNIDIAVSSGKKGERRLKYLAGELEKLMLHYEDKNVIINDTIIGPNKLIDAGIVDLNGGLESAVGNLFIFSEDNVSFKFNMNSDTLNNNAKVLLELLNSKINDLDSYRLNIDVEGFPKLSLKSDARDKSSAKDFFNKLWFYTNQAKEEEIDCCCKELLEDYCITTKNASERTTSGVRCEAMYLKIHDDVQKWWMLEGEVTYLTNERKHFDAIVKEFLQNSLLTIFSNAYIERMKTYNLQFDEVSVRTLSTQFGTDCTVIVTEVITLTGIKLVQHFQTLKEYAFFELDSHSIVSRTDRNILIEEVKNNKLQTLIIIYDDISASKSEFFRYMIKNYASKRLILVTNANSYDKLINHIGNRTFIKVPDQRIQFRDLVPTSQKNILTTKLIFQGIEISFDAIIQEDGKHLITLYLLQKIINNDTIEVGRTVTNPSYEEIKYYYLDRQLSIKADEFKKELFSESAQVSYVLSLNSNRHYERRINVKLNSFEEISGVIVLIGAPGIGKSTYLTHVSIETKRLKPEIWIERINLLDYTKEFHRWQENKIKIDRIEALKFVCKSAMSKTISRNRHNSFNETDFDLAIVDGELVVTYHKEHVSASTELEMFVYSYNKGKTVLLFDGFDEICPHYKDEITDLLKCLVTTGSSDISTNISGNEQRMWIVSRSYNNIVETLQTEFGTPYDLKEPLLKELKVSMVKYFKTNFNFDELNYNQFMNIDEFLDHMKKKEELHLKLKYNVNIKFCNFLLHEMYFAAADYFLSEAKNIHITDERYPLAVKWLSNNNKNNDIPPSLDLANHNLVRKKAMHLKIPPLYLFIALENFKYEIKNISLANSNNASRWDVEANTLTFYKHFLETQVKKRYFEQKIQMDVYNPDVKLRYEKELKEFFDKHKRMAFYASYYKNLGDILRQGEIDTMRNIIKELEDAENKTGIVDCIVNGVPKFIHLTFQEYLTAEYLTDLFKTKPKNKYQLIRFITTYVNSCVLEFIAIKVEYDNELKRVFEADDEILKFFKLVHDGSQCIFEMNDRSNEDSAIKPVTKSTDQGKANWIFVFVTGTIILAIIYYIFYQGILNTLLDTEWAEFLNFNTGLNR